MQDVESAVLPGGGGNGLILEFQNGGLNRFECWGRGKKDNLQGTSESTEIDGKGGMCVCVSDENAETLEMLQRLKVLK